MDFEIYTDESCPEVLKHPESHKFMAIGGIWIPADCRAQLKEDLSAIRKQYNIRGEMKWNKVSPAFLDFYKEIVGYFFKTDFIRARVVVIESGMADQLKLTSGDAEMGFYKFYYQLVHYWVLDFNSYDVFLDYKLNRSKGVLKELKEKLISSNLTATVKNVQALPSEQSLGIQLADVITGLVTAKFNDEITGPAKKSLIELAESAACIGRPIAATAKAEEKLNVFATNLAGGW